MEALVEQIRRELPSAEARGCLETLARVLANILQHPAEAKYRTLKRSSRAFTERLQRSPAAVSLLLAVGFEDLHGEAFGFPPDADFEQAGVALEAIQTELLRDAETGSPPSSSSCSVPLRERRPASPADAQADSVADLRKLQAERYRDYEFDLMFSTEEPPTAPAPSPIGRLGGPSEAAVPPGGTPLGAAPAPPPSGGPRRPLPKSEFKFAKRVVAAGRQEKAAESLAEVRRLQRERFIQGRPSGDAGPSPLEQLPASGTLAAPVVCASEAATAEAQPGWHAWLPSWVSGLPSPQGADSATVRLQPQEHDVRTVRF